LKLLLVKCAGAPKAHQKKGRPGIHFPACLSLLQILQSPYGLASNPARANAAGVQIYASSSSA
jgi:hypothetical protein